MHTIVVKLVSPKCKFWATKTALVHYFCCFFNEVLNVCFERMVVQFCQPKEIIFLFMLNNKNPQKWSYHVFSPDNNNTHPHTPRHSQNTSTDRSPSLKMLNYIFKPQQLDIICLLKRAGSSWVSIYTQTHTHTHPYIFTHTNIACQLPRHWHDWDLQQVNIWDFFAFSFSQTTSFGAFRSHNIKNHSNMTTNIYLYC